MPGSVWIYTAASGAVVDASFGGYDGKAAELRANDVRLADRTDMAPTVWLPLWSRPQCCSVRYATGGRLRR